VERWGVRRWDRLRRREPVPLKWSLSPRGVRSGTFEQGEGPIDGRATGFGQELVGLGEAPAAQETAAGQWRRVEGLEHGMPGNVNPLLLRPCGFAPEQEDDATREIIEEVDD